MKVRKNWRTGKDLRSIQEMGDAAEEKDRGNSRDDYEGNFHVVRFSVSLESKPKEELEDRASWSKSYRKKMKLDT